MTAATPPTGRLLSEVSHVIQKLVVILLILDK